MEINVFILKNGYIRLIPLMYRYCLVKKNVTKVKMKYFRKRSSGNPSRCWCLMPKVDGLSIYDQTSLFTNFLKITWSQIKNCHVRVYLPRTNLCS